LHNKGRVGLLGGMLEMNFIKILHGTEKFVARQEGREKIESSSWCIKIPVRDLVFGLE